MSSVWHAVLAHHLALSGLSGLERPVAVAVEVHDRADGAAGRDDSRVPSWGAFPSRGIHRDQTGDGQQGGGAFL
jgi:hypothetical protein